MVVGYLDKMFALCPFGSIFYSTEEDIQPEIEKTTTVVYY